MRTTQAGLVLEGPVDLDTSLGLFEVELFNTDRARVSNETETNIESIPGQGSNESITAPLEGKRSVRYDGDTSFSRLNKAYGSRGRKDSVRQWLASVEALVLSQQGLGWKVTDRARSDTYDPVTDRGMVITSSEWSYSPDSGERLSWGVDGELSEGAQPAKDPSGYVSTRRSGTEPTTDSLQVAGFTFEFSYVESRRVTRNVSLNNTEMIHQTEDSPMAGLIESGVETEVKWDGTLYASDSFTDDVKDFDRRIQGEEASLHDSFAGTVWNGTISDSNSTVEAGRPNRFDFDLTLDVGQVLV